MNASSTLMPQTPVGNAYATLTYYSFRVFSLSEVRRVHDPSYKDDATVSSKMTRCARCVPSWTRSAENLRMYQRIVLRACSWIEVVLSAGEAVQTSAVSRHGRLGGSSLSQKYANPAIFLLQVARVE